MTRPRTFLTLVLCGSTLGLVLAAHQGPPPPPPPPPSPPERAPVRDSASGVIGIGTASIAGRIVTDDAASQPVRRATVRIAGADGFGGQLAITDDKGQFTFSNLAAGRYSITATKAGFVSGAFGAKRPEGPGAALGLTDGQHVTDVTLRMLRGAVITGTIRDPKGEPSAGMAVTVLRYRVAFATGQRQLQAARSPFGESTDDRGVYRLYGLAPGDYVVLANAGIGGGRSGNDVHQVTPAEVQWATRQIPGPGQPSASPGPAPAPAPNVVFAPVFHPGTTSESAATTITVKAGEERAGIDVSLVLVPTAKIDGTITSPDGVLPPNLQVNLIAQDRIEGIPFSGFNTAPAVRDGKFTFTGLSPGQYTITVRATANPLGAAGRGGPPATTTPAMLALYGLTDVTVNGQDATATITLQPGVTVSGRIGFDGTTLPPPTDLTKARVSLNAVITGKGAALGVPAATVEATGGFTFTGVAPGRYQVQASMPGSTATTGWQPRSAAVGGVDSLDTPFDVGASDVSGLQVRFTDHPADLSGDIRDAAGHAAPEYFVIVFASDRNLWKPQSRRIQAKRPGSDGHFDFPNLPPGDYQIAALTDVEQGEWNDPAFLAQLLPASIKVTLGEGEKTVQNITLAGGK